MDDIFSGEVEGAQNEINQSQNQDARQELPGELQEQLSNIESLVAMSPDVVETDEYKDLMAKIDAHHSSQASDDDEEEED